MRILVVSDTHGDLYSLKQAVSRQSTAEIIVHCGDSRGEMDDIKLLHPNKMTVCVKGNCDLGSTLKPYEIFNVCNKRIFVTHGHMYNVKQTMYNLSCIAKENKADILLFGHTHQSLQLYYDGLYILNPGSLCGYNGTYGYIDITDKGILTNIVSLN